MTKPRLTICLALFAAAVRAQSAFDVSSVQVSPRENWVKDGANAMRGGFLTGDRYEIHRATMLDLIKLAYNVDADKVYGGPSWLDYDKYEVVAKTKPGTRPEALRQMLQSLLTDRFQLSVKPDTQPLPAYVLSAGKDQTKLKSAEGSAGTCQNIPPSGPIRDAAAGLAQAELRCPAVTMDEFVGGLRRLATVFFQGVPVINSTGLEGSWDIDIKYAPLVTRISAAGKERINANSIFEAIDKQLGLKLELGKAPQPVLSVVTVKEQPSPDAPGAAAALPPLLAPQFEVAVIRPCDANPANGPVRTVTPRFEPGGRVTATCFPLLAFVRQNLNLTANEEVTGLPKSLQNDSNTTRISIDARAPAGLVPNNADTAQTRDLLNELLKGLLVDRYKLTYHYEDRPEDALTLVAAKPKMTKADPSGRTGCKQTSQNGVKLVCTNITMAQFAEQILAFYPTARYPVIDGTHLDGAWDFTLEYNPTAGLLQSLRARIAADPAAAAAGRAPDADEPTGPTNPAEAMEKQIGLKLETHKRPEPVLVIDHMEDKPADN